MFGNDDTTDRPSSGYGGGGDIAGALITAGAGLYDGYQTRKASRENTDKTIAAQKSEAELAYQRSVEMWNMQNLYNSPQAQMQRFQAAGLNPHLIYGQGNAGNASSPPQYQPANMQYRYEAPAYGSAVASALPMLMSVGTWMQNMRLSEAELNQKRTNTERAAQMVEYLSQANPRLLEALQNRNDIFPYQYQAQRYNTDMARQKLFEFEQKFRYDYGDDLFGQMGSAFEKPGGDKAIAGMKRLLFLQQMSKTQLEQARASWTDFGITSPQAIMQLVLQGVMGMAGQTLKARPSMFKGSRQSQTPSRIKTFYDKGRRRSQVVDFD